MKRLFLPVICLLTGFFAQAETITHEYIDLGLPSGTKWATMNIGADSVRGIGAFFAYGDIQPDYVTAGKFSDYERSFDWANYKWCNSDSYHLTRYCSNSMYGDEGFTDGLTTLLPEDDAATAFWGSNWRTPTINEYIELWSNCTCEMVTENGVMGMRMTSRVPGYENRSIFFPNVGLRKGTDWGTYDDGKVSCYMSATSDGVFFDFFAFPDQQEIYYHTDYRCLGANVRAVYNETEEHHTFVDLGLNVLWAASNIGTDLYNDAGKYFSWGDTINIALANPATWENYIYGTENALTKYNNKAECGSVDGLTTLQPQDDPATHFWGSTCHMPDTADWRELKSHCTWTWVSDPTNPGYLITSNVPGYEQAQIFLPATGYADGIKVFNYTSDFYYFTSHLDSTDPNKAISVYFSDQEALTIQSDFRYYGFACRPVKSKTHSACKEIRSNTIPARKYLNADGVLTIRRNGINYTVMGLPR